MGKSERTRIVIEKFRKRIEAAEKGRKEVIKILQDLKDLWIDKGVTLGEYKDLADEKIKGKTLGEWIEYYDSYIAEAKSRIEEQEWKLRKSNATKNLLVVIAPIILILVFVVIFYLIPE